MNLHQKQTFKTDPSEIKCRESLYSKRKQQTGFTLMEIMVSTTIFAIVAVSLLSLFNYVLKINRKTEALRQASQGMRNFVELLVKEIRNGQIDYYVANGQTWSAGITNAPCGPKGDVGTSVKAPIPNRTYDFKENKLGLINTENIQECFYLADDLGVYAGASKFLGNAVSTRPIKNLMMMKSGVATAQVLNPPNFSVKKLMFLIRPVCDPYIYGPSATPSGTGCSDYLNNYPRIQPTVTIFIHFEVTLPTKEVVPIYYQTTVSSNKYDIPSP
ncbi:MAG: type II secretion system protein [Candidatus Doudnabacteria bacterium]|jgi:prepilin-type N-terminal cleavage/methylation domain-containing protein